MRPTTTPISCPLSILILKNPLLPPLLSARTEDVAHESLASAFGTDQGRGARDQGQNQSDDGHMSGLLYIVSRNIVFEESERRSREVQWQIDEAILEANAARIDEAVHYEQMLEVFCEAMGILPKAHQRAILLRRVYGLSHKEIAKKMRKGRSRQSNKIQKSLRVFRPQPSHGKVVTEGLTSADGSATIGGPERSI
jgi:RNA polymerase sigma-70 factor (ECF subfamily)